MKRVALFVAGDRPFYRFGRLVLVLLVAAPLRLRAEGAENLPGSGAALIAVSHKSDLDPILAGLAFRRQLRFFAKAELFDRRLLGRVIRGLGAIPVRRGEGDRRALETSLAMLAAGDALMIFPEGTRFAGDDEIHPFQAGVGMLALRSGAPVVPVAVCGSRHINVGRGQARRLPPVRARIGAPVALGDLEGGRSADYREAAARVEAAVRELYD